MPELNEDIDDCNEAASPTLKPVPARFDNDPKPPGMLGIDNPFIAALCAEPINPVKELAPGIAFIAPVALLTVAPAMLNPPGKLLMPLARAAAADPPAPEFTIVADADNCDNPPDDSEAPAPPNAVTLLIPETAEVNMLFDSEGLTPVVLLINPATPPIEPMVADVEVNEFGIDPSAFVNADADPVIPGILLLIPPVILVTEPNDPDAIDVADPNAPDAEFNAPLTKLPTALPTAALKPTCVAPLTNPVSELPAIPPTAPPTTPANILPAAP